MAGVRTWRLANTLWARMGGWLWSLAMLDCWRPPRIEPWKEAECDQGHRIPDAHHGCGIWAFYNPAVMAAEFGPRPGGPESPYEYVSGVIGGGGDILPADWGFRAQYAKVLAIFDDQWDTPKGEIAEQYGCPIIARDEYDAFCEKWDLLRLDQV